MNPDSEEAADKLYSYTPVIFVWQLVGDSQFIRLCTQVFNMKLTLGKNQPAQIGFCVSGQTISELTALIEKYYKHLSTKVIIMIGTNDVKNRTPRHEFIAELHKLHCLLESKTIIWLTIPPIPKFNNDVELNALHHDFNKEIMKLTGLNTTVVDTYKAFVDQDNVPLQDHFEQNFRASIGKPAREDNIHLNERGLVRLSAIILYALLPEKFDIPLNYKWTSSAASSHLQAAFEYIKPMLEGKYDKREKLDLEKYFLGKLSFSIDL